MVDPDAGLREHATSVVAACAGMTVREELWEERDFCAAVLHRRPSMVLGAQFERWRDDDAMADFLMGINPRGHFFWLSEALQCRPRFYSQLLLKEPALLARMPERVWLQDSAVVRACVLAEPKLYAGMPSACPLFACPELAAEVTARAGSLLPLPGAVLLDGPAMLAVVARTPRLVHCARFPRNLVETRAVFRAALEADREAVMAPPSRQDVGMPVNNFQTAGHRRLQAAALESDFERAWAQIFPSPPTRQAALEIEAHWGGFLQRALFARFSLAGALRLQEHRGAGWAKARMWLRSSHPRSKEGGCFFAARSFDLDLRQHIFRLVVSLHAGYGDSFVVKDEESRLLQLCDASRGGDMLATLHMCLS